MSNFILVLNVKLSVGIECQTRS